jgi:hypothetical protein
MQEGDEGRGQAIMGSQGREGGGRRDGWEAGVVMTSHRYALGRGKHTMPSVMPCIYVLHAHIKGGGGWACRGPQGVCRS